MTPPYGLRAGGPLTTGACEGDGSGAGVRLSKVGICGAGLPRRVVGSSRTTSAPCARTPRAKLGVDPTTQATAKTAAKTRFMDAPRSAPASLHARIEAYDLTR